MSVTVKWIAAVLLLMGAVVYMPGVAGFALLAAAVLVMPVSAVQKLFAGKTAGRIKTAAVTVLLIVSVFFAPQGGFVADAMDHALVPKQDYVLNINSMRFHLPECDGAKDIKSENRRERTCTREELIEEEFIPCGACQP